MAYRIRHESPYGRRRAGALGVVLAAGMVARIAHGEYSDFRANQAEPACDVTATAYGTQKGTVSGIRDELARAGDGGNSAMVFAGQDGHLRNPNNPSDASRYFVNGSMALQPGDTVRVMHVGADVCQAAGGTAVSLAAIEASMEHRQK